MDVIPRSERSLDVTNKHHIISYTGYWYLVPLLGTWKHQIGSVVVSSSVSYLQSALLAYNNTCLRPTSHSMRIPYKQNNKLSYNGIPLHNLCRDNTQQQVNRIGRKSTVICEMW